MPHIELKTTANLPKSVSPGDLLKALVAKMSTFETVSPAAVKAYHVPIATWEMGRGAPSGFMHCTVSVLTGRPLELRRRMASEMAEVLRSALTPDIGAGDLSVTLELREMSAETYVK